MPRFFRIFAALENDGIMTRSTFIQQHSNLFWYTPADKKEDISDALLVERVLNDGTLEDYHTLLQVLTPQRVAEVFFGATERQGGNYYPEIRNFFSILLSKYAH